MKFVFFSLFLLSISNVLSQGESIVFEKDLYGSWRIDSSAENRAFNRRPAINEEFFVFDETGFFRMKKIDDGGTDTKTIGRYQLSGDTIRITTMNGGTDRKSVV